MQIIPRWNRRRVASRYYGVKSSEGKDLFSNHLLPGCFFQAKLPTLYFIMIDKLEKGVRLVKYYIRTINFLIMNDINSYCRVLRIPSYNNTK